MKTERSKVRRAAMATAVIGLAAVVALATTGCASGDGGASATSGAAAVEPSSSPAPGRAVAGSATPGGASTTGAAQAPGLERAIFAGGCFWCMEPPFDKLDGVVSTTSGYTGGHLANPSYEQVSAGGTGHAESVEIVFDPSRISYEKLLDVYWHNVDPTTPNRQFCDFGSQYRTAIFTLGEEQHRAAEASKGALEASGKLPGPIVTEIVPAKEFYPAEEYHQDYYQKNPVRYRFYRSRCGRDHRLEELWGEAAAH